MKMIVSVDQKWGIGFQGQLLKRVPEDMKQFKQKTTGKTVIMGRDTFESLPNGQPLVDRLNIVLSTTLVQDPSMPNLLVVRSIEELFKYLFSNVLLEDSFIIGGEKIYRQLTPYCTEAYITKWEHTYQADRFIDNLDKLPNWREISVSAPMQHHDTVFRFVRYINEQPMVFRV